ncbi:MAG: tetratricopeptide repeat protein [Xanthomonadales bacterium]|nr:tetratricopeptide repeat protein [Xanthomonadales bacterium]
MSARLPPAPAIDPPSAACDGSADAVLAQAARLARERRFDAAVAVLQPCLRRHPDHWPLASALVDLHEAQGAIGKAIEQVTAYVADTPSAAEAWYRLAGLWSRGGRRDAAIPAAQRAVALRPDWPAALNRLGGLLEPDDPAQAETLFARALAADPHSRPARLNLARCLRDRGDPSAAIALLQETVDRAPDDAQARIALAEAQLQAGRFAEGWAGYAWRFGEGGRVPRHPGTEAPVWDGEPLDGRIVMVWLEQGLGDQLQCCRWLPDIAAAGGRIWLQTPRTLRPLLETPGVVERFFDEGETPRGFDLQIPLMSLPHALRRTRRDIPPAPYLTASPERSAACASLLAAADGRLRVGLVHASRPDHPAAARRDCPLAAFEALSDIPGVALYSLQFGEAAAAAARAQSWPLVDLSPVLGDFAQTAAIVRALDLVVTVDTAMAHLCGALGHPVWTLLSTPCDWRWGVGRDDTPWYPSMRLYRQSIRGDWGAPLAAVRHDLARSVAERLAAGA